MIKLTHLAAATGLAALISTSAAAQSAQKVSLQFSVLGASLSGNAFDGLGTGSGFEAQVRYNASALSIGGGFQWTAHSLTDFTNKVHLSGAFVEPRYLIATKSNTVAPYVSLRLSVLKESGSFDATAGKVGISASGVTANAGGGLLFRLGSRLNLDTGLTFGYTNFGKVTTKLDGQVVTSVSGFDAGSGSNVVFRLGLAFGVGK
jgi:hypothetical protein